MEPLHTVEQAAKILQLHPDTVRIWLRDGRLKGRKMGRVWRIAAAELQRLSEAPAEQPQESSLEAQTS